MKGMIIKVGTFEWLHGQDGESVAKLSEWTFDAMGKVPALDVQTERDVVSITDDYAILPADAKMAGWTMYELDAIANGMQ